MGQMITIGILEDTIFESISSARVPTNWQLTLVGWNDLHALIRKKRTFGHGQMLGEDMGKLSQ